MYSFCPCSCAKGDVGAEHEEDVLISGCLPRNLSYVGESYLDRYSVSSAFVHNAKADKQQVVCNSGDGAGGHGGDGGDGEERYVSGDDDVEEGEGAAACSFSPEERDCADPPRRALLRDSAERDCGDSRQALLRDSAERDFADPLQALLRDSAERDAIRGVVREGLRSYAESDALLRDAEREGLLDYEREGLSLRDKNEREGSRDYEREELRDYEREGLLRDKNERDSGLRDYEREGLRDDDDEREGLRDDDAESGEGLRDAERESLRDTGEALCDQPTSEALREDCESQEEEVTGEAACGDVDGADSPSSYPSETSDVPRGAGAMAHTHRHNPAASHSSFRGGPGDNCDVTSDVTSDVTLSLPVSPSPISKATVMEDDDPSHPASFRPSLTASTGQGDGEGDDGQHQPKPEQRHHHQSDFERYVQTMESPDSDMVSEEGIFVNMLDDDLEGDGLAGKSTLSEASDDTYASGDSMYYSPREADDASGSQEELRVSLEAAVSKAACDLHQHLDSLRLEDDDVTTTTTPSDPSQQDQDRCAVPPLQLAASDEQQPRQDGEGVVRDSESAPAERESTVTAPASAAATENVIVQQPQDSAESQTKDSAADSGNEGSLPESASTPSSTDGSCSASAKEGGDKKAGASGSSSSSKTGLKITLNDRPFNAEERQHPQLSASYKDLVSPESPLYEDREFNFRRSELRKSTSLKSSKTPPGTPRRKKVVRFADAMGLDLESVRHILNLESPPKIPASAMKDLQSGLGEARKDMGTKFIVETFPQPGGAVDFRERVVAQRVCLENALVVSGSITGVVRVANIAFHKSVRVRFTTNNWGTFHDIAASYVANSNDGASDRFSFTIVPPLDFGAGGKLQFAVSFTANGAEFWDNNYGVNYVFECFAKTVPTDAENSWMHFL